MHTTADQQNAIESLYQTGYAGFRVDDFFVQTVKKEITDRISKFMPLPADLLDVGCGNGEFLRVAQDMKYNCLGIDISKESQALCKKRNVESLAEDFVNYDFGKPFDIITMWDVMEHLREPKRFVNKAFSILQEQGILLLKIPTFGDLNFTYLRVSPTSSRYLLGAPGHIQYYSELSISTLLKEAGFSGVYWMESQKFRTRRPTTSLKRKIARGLQKVASRTAKNQNFYMIATKGTIGQDINPDLYRRFESFV